MSPASSPVAYDGRRFPRRTRFLCRRRPTTASMLTAEPNNRPGTAPSQIDHDTYGHFGRVQAMRRAAVQAVGGKQMAA